MSVLVTGGFGFIGSYVVRELLDRHEALVVLTREDELPPDERVLPASDLANLSVERGDVTDPRMLDSIIAAHGVTRIAHLASILTDAAEADPHEAVRVNCLGLANVLNQAHRHAVRRVVCASSSTVLGPASNAPHGAAHETSPVLPTSIYATTKRMGEELVEYYSRCLDLDIICLRFNLVYGVGRKRGAAQFISALFSPKIQQTVHVENGESRFSWQHVRDAAGVTVAALFAPRPKQPILNTNGSPSSVRDVGALIEQLVPGARFSYGPGVLDVVWQIDDRQAATALGYQPRFSLQEGVAEVLTRGGYLS